MPKLVTLGGTDIFRRDTHFFTETFKILSSARYYVIGLFPPGVVVFVDGNISSLGPGHCLWYFP